MRAPWSASAWIGVLVALVCVGRLCSSDSMEATHCQGCEAWEALEYVYNSTGNLTDIGYNRTIGGGSGATGHGGANSTTDRNASIPMPNNSGGMPSPSPSPTKSKSDADARFTAKATAATMAVVILLVAT